MTRKFNPWKFFNTKKISRFTVYTSTRLYSDRRNTKKLTCLARLKWYPARMRWNAYLRTNEDDSTRRKAWAACSRHKEFHKSWPYRERERKREREKMVVELRFLQKKNSNSSQVGSYCTSTTNLMYNWETSRYFFLNLTVSHSKSDIFRECWGILTTRTTTTKKTE